MDGESCLNLRILICSGNEKLHIYSLNLWLTDEWEVGMM